MSGKTEKVILGIILLVGAILRLYNYWDFSLSNDELSALARLNYDSFSDLIMNGVRIDGHPPAAQLILWYMTGWFGNSVAVVRLPFVLAGIVSVYFMFKLGKEWIGTSAGLLSAAVFATLQFPILYSRIARPYALGMLFTLMAAYFWIRVVKGRHAKSDHIWLAVSLALCAYSHYFAALVAAILAFSGTLLISGENLRRYLFALAGAFLLYLAYIPIFLHQLSLGGVGQWLGPPENDWLWEHVRYVFNDSWIVLPAVLAAAFLGPILYRKVSGWKNHLLPLVLFICPFLFGFAYSKWINPVLQHSTLLFSFPFLLVFLFSGWRDDDANRTIMRSTVAVLLITVTVSSVFEKRFFQKDHFGVFKQLAQHTINWKHEAKNDVLLIGDYNLPFYLNYYLDRLEPTQLALYRTTDKTGLAELKSIVDTSSKEFVIYSWSTVNQIPEVEEIIRQKFPVEMQRKGYFNSEIVMFMKGQAPSRPEKFPFTKTESWNFNPDAVATDSFDNRSVLISAENPYGPTYMCRVSELLELGYSEVTIFIRCTETAELGSTQLVYEQVNENGGYAWESDELKRQFKLGGPDWGVFHYRIKPAESPEDVLKIYVWSPNGERTAISTMEIGMR